MLELTLKSHEILVAESSFEHNGDGWERWEKEIMKHLVGVST